MFLNTPGKIWVILKLGNRFPTAIPPFITAIFLAFTPVYGRGKCY